MKKYEVTIIEHCCGVAVVEAENENEAQDLAYELWSEGKVPMTGDMCAETGDTKEIS